MINKKTIPDWWYAAATSACTVAVFLILWPRHMDTNAITLLLGTVGIVAVLSIVTGIYIKKNIEIDSKFLDLIEVCAIPVYVYLSLRLVGYGKCLKCISIVIIVWLFYTAILIKVNVVDHHKHENRRYLNKVIATGLHNIRFIVLMALVAQMMFTHQNLEKDHKCYLQYADSWIRRVGDEGLRFALMNMSETQIRMIEELIFEDKTVTDIRREMNLTITEIRMELKDMRTVLVAAM